MTTAPATSALWTWRRRRPASDVGRRSNRRPRPRPQPLHEALAIGLGCESFDHRITPPPEWR